MNTECLWDRLARSDKPIVLYGTGNGADKILDVCASRAVRVSGVFASDGFVRNRVFRGMKVESYDGLCARLGEDITVLMAFGSDRPEVLSFLRLLDARHELVVPEVPLYGGALFDGTYYDEKRPLLDAARELFFDERSRLLFDDAVRFRLTGKLSCLADAEEAEKTLADLRPGRLAPALVVDGGAYRGDSAALFARVLGPEEILAAEADPKNAERLSEYARSETRCRVTPVCAALGSRDGTLLYRASANRGASAAGHSRRARKIEIRSVRLSTLLSDRRADFIKLDLEGAEADAIEGGRDVLLRDQPDMAVSLYHRTDDLYALPLLLRSLLPEHRFYLRRPPAVPMWDLTLYALKP